MTMQAWFSRSEQLAGAPGMSALSVTSEEWRALARDFSVDGGRLAALWASGDRDHTPIVRAAFLGEGRGLVASLRLASPDERYPNLDELFPAAARMQRAVSDLCGLQCAARDLRPWLRHAAWQPPFAPLADALYGAAPMRHAPAAHEFVRVEGEGVHEVPVGPVHAGIIEPGHFRFSVVGEKVLKLEERLGYVHKGIERRFTELPLLDAQRLAARVSGDSAVAFSWAYCQALEGIAGVTLAPRPAHLRALALELERIANHLGDLGALGNDAGFAFGLMQFSRLKEELLRATESALGERYLMNFVVPGGTRTGPTPAQGLDLRRCVASIMEEAAGLRSIYDEHAGVRDRFVGAGRVDPELAAKLGLIGLAGRASGQAFDARVDLACAPYADLRPRKIVRREGDVAARVAVRFEELGESGRLVLAILDHLPAGSHGMPIPIPSEPAFGVGLIEGWRGPVFVALETNSDATIRRCHPHDPSWQNWPVLEHAIVGNIVPDFPLINKSFNLSYSGHDL